jgi:serine-type D-Ala-D-Ala carboxypeptidase/endopeptidase (penicillin-binding protein 4)
LRYQSIDNNRDVLRNFSDMITKHRLSGFFCIPILLIVGLTSAGISAQSADSLNRNAFDTAITNFSSLATLKHASWGLCVIDIAGDTVYRAVNEHLSLIPASTLKPFTSGAVLRILGKDFRFCTPFSTDGIVDSSGTLQGNLYIEGRGDPTFGSARFGDVTHSDSIFQRLFKALQGRGIRKINGAIIADASWFSAMPVSPSWQYEDIGNSYGAGSPGLSVNDNQIAFVYAPGKRAGDSAVLIGTRPDASYLEINSEVTTGPRGSGDGVNVYGAPYSSFRWLRGTVPAGVKEFAVVGAMPDPAYHAAWSLHAGLVAQGIEIREQPATSLRRRWMGIEDTLPRTTLMSHLSPTLAEIVYVVNFRSMNMYTEAIVKALGKSQVDQGTTEAGLSAVLAYWNNLALDLSGVSLKDGSGLARKNLMTAKVLATALAKYTSEPTYPEFYASFPVAGETGSVAGRFRKSAARGNLRAKSGTMEKVKGFSGYATTASGRRISYSLIINSYSGSHDDLMKEIEVLLTKMCEIND